MILAYPQCIMHDAESSTRLGASLLRERWNLLSSIYKADEFKCLILHAIHVYELCYVRYIYEFKKKTCYILYQSLTVASQRITEREIVALEKENHLQSEIPSVKSVRAFLSEVWTGMFYLGKHETHP